MHSYIFNGHSMCVYELKTHKSYTCYKPYSSNFSEILDFLHIDLHKPSNGGSLNTVPETQAMTFSQ